MFEWRNKRVSCNGSVLFPGSLPPKDSDFAPLQTLGYKLRRTDPVENAHWVLSVEGNGIEKGLIMALRNPPKLPRVMVDWATELTSAERDAAMTGRATISVTFDGNRNDILRDRKSLLKLLGAIMNGDGVLAIDHVAERMWSREALNDELSHDADLDIEALYTLHAVGDEQGRAAWLHTHGLANIGLFDFDVMYPHPDYAGVQTDVPRAIALAIAEKKFTMGNTFSFAGGVPALAVPAATFDRRASDADKKPRVGSHDHTEDRAVLCEPAGWLSKLIGGPPKPLRYLQHEPDPRIPLSFSNESNEMMTQRALGSLPLFKKLVEEFAPLGFTPAVKLAYETDGGGDFDGEHMWFEAHAFDDSRVDATLSVQPFNIARMKPGDRNWHDLSRLSDWLIVTPAGNITPRNTTPARVLRPHREEILAAMAKEKEDGDLLGD